MALPQSRTMDNDLNFLNYMSKLKHLDRTGWVRHEVPRPETVASHMYRMAVMAAFVVEDSGLDMNKCIKMALAHDMGESIIGDITPHCGVADSTKAELEAAAINKLTGLIGPGKGDEIRALFQEYEEGKTKEAKLVKDLDKFDMILQAYEYEQRENKPRFLQQFFDSNKETFLESHPYIQKLVSKLMEAREFNVPFS